MRRRVFWVALAILVACAVYGFLHERLFDQYLWSEQGIKRVIRASAIYWAVAGLLIWFKREWFLPAVCGFVFLYSAWWCGRYFEWWAPLAVLYFLGSCFLLGRWITRGADAFTSLLAGLAIWTFVISIIVRFPINTPAVYAILFLIPYARFRYKPLAIMPGSPALALVVFVLLLHWLVTLKPEISSDGLAMHLTIPMAVAHETRWAFDFDRYTWALMPMGGDWGFTAAYVIGGEAAARLLNFSLLVVIAAMIYRGSRRWLNPSLAMVVSALFLSTPLVQMVTGSLFVENVWAAMILGGAFALWQGELVWAGLLFGAAMSTKVGTIAYLLPAAIIAARLRPQARTAAIATALFVIFAAPPYLNSFLRTGNPMFPFYNHVFKSKYFDTDPTSVQDVRLRKKVNWKAAYDSTFRSADYYEGQNGSAGFQYFLFLLPMLLLLKRGAPAAIITLGVAGLVLTFVTIPNLRYVYPALPLLTIGMAWMLSEMPLMLAGMLAVIALNIWFLPASNWYHKDFALFRRIQMQEYMSTGAPQRKLIEYLNQKAPGEAVAFFAGSPVAGLWARGYSDQWRTYKFWKQMIGSRSPAEVAALFHELGIKHIIAPQPIDFEFLPVRNFLQTGTVLSGVKSGRYALLEVIPPPPPESKEPLPLAEPGSYDDLDPRIEFTGGWAQGRDFKNAYKHSVTYSRFTYDLFRFTFEGSGITYVFTKAANRGFAEIWIDGHVRESINLYSRETQWQAQKVFAGLRPGRHQFEVRVQGKKDPQATDTYVDLDRLIVR